MYGNSAAFFVVSTAFLRTRGGESYPCAAENRLQRRAGRACAGLRCGAGQASGRRQKGAGWARTITDAMQTNAINGGSGQRGYWRSSRIFYCTLHFYQKDCARDRQKNRSGREQLTPSPLSSISIMGVANTGRGPSVNSAWPEFSGGGLPHDLTLYFLHYS